MIKSIMVKKIENFMMRRFNKMGITKKIMVPIRNIIHSIGNIKTWMKGSRRNLILGLIRTETEHFQAENRMKNLVSKKIRSS